jgi:undecaprenyl-diphosphatase
VDTLIVVGAKYVIFIIAVLAIIATLFSERTVRCNIIKLALLSFPIAFLASVIAGHLFYDTRPFVAEQSKPLISHAADNGFPSDHTLYAMVAAATIFVYGRKLGLFLGILGVLVGVFRVMAKLHYPIDIAGSIAIAIVATSLAWLILKTLRNNRHLTGRLE